MTIYKLHDMFIAFVHNIWSTVAPVRCLMVNIAAEDEEVFLLSIAYLPRLF